MPLSVPKVPGKSETGIKSGDSVPKVVGKSETGTKTHCFMPVLGSDPRTESGMTLFRDVDKA